MNCRLRFCVLLLRSLLVCLLTQVQPRLKLFYPLPLRVKVNRLYSHTQRLPHLLLPCKEQLPTLLNAARWLLRVVLVLMECLLLELVLAARPMFNNRRLVRPRLYTPLALLSLVMLLDKPFPRQFLTPLQQELRLLHLPPNSKCRQCRL